MPFDGSGNFSRLYSWQQDRDNNIKILASRMDDEFNNFSSGMNQVFFRNGLVPMANNLNLGQNYLVGLGAGSVNAPAVRFGDDGSSGLYLNGFNRPTIAVAGANRLEVNTTGIAVAGGISTTGLATLSSANVSGPLGVGGTFVAFGNSAFTGDVAAASKITAVGQIAGGALSSAGPITRDPTFYLNMNGADPLINFDTNDYIQYGRSGDTLNTVIGGAVAATLSASVANFAGQIRQNGADVWSAANFNPGNYAALSGANFTGAVSATSLTSGSTINRDAQYYMGLSSGDPLLNFDANDFLQYLRATNVMRLNIGGANVASISAAAANFNGALQQGGQQVWHAANFNPANYAALSGATFTGAVNGTAFQASGNIGASGEMSATRYRSTANGDGFGILFGDDAWMGDVNQASTVGIKGNTDAASGFVSFGAPGNRLGVSGNGPLQYLGNTVWHGGNFNPASYAPLSGATFTGAVRAPQAIISTSGNGYLQVDPGTPTQPGYVSFYNASGTRAGYMGLSSGGRIVMAAENGMSGFLVAGDLISNGQGAYANQVQSGLSAKMSRGTGAPSGGSDGDMYFQYA